jgi:dienelactone hydrolase
LVLTGVILLPAGETPGQETKPRQADVVLDKYLAWHTDALSKRPFNGLLEGGQWQEQRPRLRQEYLDMLGLWPLPEKSPLHATVTGTRERDGVVIEKLHFQSRPRLYVTGNLYRPKPGGGKLPAILYVCGHSGRGRDGNKTAFQEHGMWFASNGYVCLVIDTLQLGEIPGIHHGTYREGRWWWQARGYTPAGVECWNGVRALDYLIGRPEVDPERLGVTGISGGGAATFWIAAADERVKCAVPVSGMSDLESYVKNKVINGHCDCMFLINTYGWEWTTIAGLAAPRPLLFCNSDDDKIFPMDGNRRLIERLRQLYAHYGKPELVDDYVSKGGHDYRPDLRVAVFKWFNKHLKNDSGPVQDADFKPLPGPELRVFPEDKDVPADAINGKVDETFVAAGRPELPPPGGFEGWKSDLVRRIRQQSFYTFPERVPPAKVKSGASSSRIFYNLVTEGGMLTGVNCPQPDHVDKSQPATLLVLNAEDARQDELPNWGQPFAPIRSTYFLDPRGTRRAWTRKSPPNYAERAHVLLGQTVDQGRVWDIVAAVRFLDNISRTKRPWRLMGRGQVGVLVAYAALLEPTIKEVVIVDPPASHREGPIFLNILRVLDVPDALGLLAPMPLTLVNAKDPAFERTAEIYKRAGAADKLVRQ